MEPTPEQDQAFKDAATALCGSFVIFLFPKLEEFTKALNHWLIDMTDYLSELDLSSLQSSGKFHPAPRRRTKF